PFVYVGAREGKLAVRNALLSENNKLNYNVVPYVVFTDPQVSGVGAGERFLKGLEIEYGKSVLDYNDIPIAGLIPNTKGFIKVLFSHNGKIIGVRIIGKLAGELITPYTIAMGLGVSKDKLMDVLYPFLTFSEGIIELLCGIKVGAGISIDPKNPSPRKPSPLLMPVRPPILPRVP
ncbi:MAG: hypothetical protein ABIL88_04065, partial [candidate division WOR-3 bacterium]